MANDYWVGLVKCHCQIYFPRPGINATVQIDDLRKASPLQKSSYMHTSHAVVTNHDDFLLWVQHLYLLGYLPHRDEPRSRDAAKFKFPNFPYIQ